MLGFQSRVAPRAASSQIATLFTLVLLLSFGAAPLVLAQELSENNAADWGTFSSDEAPASVADDSTRVLVGSASLKFVTASGFDTGIRYPGAWSADWDLTAKTHIVFWTYAINETPNGFQDSQPIVVLNTPTGCYTYTPNTQLVPLRSWRGYSVPLAGNDIWTRTQTDSPDLAHVSSLEIHDDTWDCGFTIYYDGVEFVTFDENGLPPPGPPPPDGVDPNATMARVLLFIYDPVLEDRGGLRMHEAYGWQDPEWLAAQVADDLAASSHGRALYSIVETVIVDDYPFFADGYKYDDASWEADTEISAWYPSEFDYARFIADANIAARVQRGDMDEVWVYAFPGAGMWESTMAGDGGYWCNSGPVVGVPSERVFVVMGWNFERGVAEAIHSYGHRAESVMVHSYGEWAPNRDTTWNAFTLLDRDAPGQGSVGNCHFPVNGVSDYDYENHRFVDSDADDWLSYPALTGARTSVNVLTWSPGLVDPHREYLNWWYYRMPHAAGRAPDWFLGNWWRYIVDVEQFKGWDGNLRGMRGVPSATLLGPASGATVSGTVRVDARASAQGAIGRVDLYVDESYLASDTMSPYGFTWDASALTGSHTLVAKAYELQNGTEGVSIPVTVTVNPPPSTVPAEVSAPGAVQPLRFTSSTELAWEAGSASGSNRFHLYRGPIAWLRDGQAGSCFKVGLMTSAASDPEVPSPGTGWFYLVTGVNGQGEGSRGCASSGAPRPATGICW